MTEYAVRDMRLRVSERLYRLERYLWNRYTLHHEAIPAPQVARIKELKWMLRTSVAVQL